MLGMEKSGDMLATESFDEIILDVEPFILEQDELGH